MARYSNVQTDFSGGLISEYILGRSDIERTSKSAREFTNFLPTLQGPAEYRYGFKHVNKLTDLDENKTVTATLTLATDEVYRIAFSNVKIKVYNSDGQLQVSTATVLVAQVDDAQDTIVFTLPLDHGYVIGDQITITGSSNSNMNATHTVTAITDTSATIVIASYGSPTTTDITITKDYVVSPYSAAELDDLRFSTETDALYVTHPLHRPKRVFPLSELISYTLTASGGEFLYGDKTGDKTSTTDVSVDDELLQSNVAAIGDTKWTIRDIVYDVEPLLEADSSTAKFNISNNESYAKITSTTDDFAHIVTSIADLTVIDANVADEAGDTITITLPTGHGLIAGDSITISGSNNANLNTTVNVNTATATEITIVISGYSGNNTGSIVIDRRIVATRMYVQYVVEETTLLGQVVVASTSANYTLADPTNKVVYVSPVRTIVDIEDNQARLFLLDNEETSTASDIAVLKNSGVPDNKIHLRADATIFSQGLKNAWVLVDDTRRSNEIPVGSTRSTTRWVNIKEHRGTEDHPVEFTSGTYDNSLYEAGSVYKILNPFTGPLYQMGPNTSGALSTTTAVLRTDGNRTYTFTNGLGTDPAHPLYHALNPVTTESLTIANLSSAKQFDVVECYNFTDDGIPKVEEYNASSNPTGNLIVPPVSANITVVQIANDVVLNSTQSSFTIDDIGRHFRGELPSGHVYMKAVRFISNNQIVAEALNVIPRNPRTLEIENSGSFTSFNFGAWFTNNFPRTVTRFEQRRVYGGTPSHPNYLFFSRADNEFSFQATQNDKTVLDTDGITYILSNQTAAIKWLDSLKDLVIGTTGGLYRVVPNEYLYGVSAKTIRIELTQEEPCSAQAISVGNSIFYPDQSGGRVLEYRYDQAIQNSASNDVSKLIYPTFVNDGIIKIQYQHTPQPRVWAVTKNGNLYCLAYHRQEEVYAWTKMDLAGATVHDITILNTGNNSSSDSIFVIVTRTNSSTVVSTECLKDSESEFAGNGTVYKTAAHLDAYIVTTKQVSETISLDVSSRFVDGDTVSVVIDGEYKGDYTVASGVPQGLTPSADYKVFIAGVKYEGVAKPMFPTWDGQNKPAYGAETQRIVSIKPFVIDSFSYSVGINGEFKDISLSTTYGVGNGFTGFDTERPVAGSTFGVDNIPTFKQTKPYPLVIASIITKTDLN
jgi:hypothetical protein